jgi:hypothetical protein
MNKAGRQLEVFQLPKEPNLRRTLNSSILKSQTSGLRFFLLALLILLRAEAQQSTAPKAVNALEIT